MDTAIILAACVFGVATIGYVRARFSVAFAAAVVAAVVIALSGCAAP